MTWKERYSSNDETKNYQRKGWCPWCGDVYDKHLFNCPHPDKLLLPDETGHIKGVD